MTITAKGRYDQLTVDRTNALEKARKASKVTIYNLIPEDDEPEVSSDFQNSYSSFGNKAVGTLAAKIMFSLVPVGQKFFRKDLEKNEFTDAEIAKIDAALSGNGTLEERLKRAIINNSNSIQNYFEKQGIRSTYNETMQHLIVAGNVVVKFTELGSRNYSINNFVIVRDNEDNIFSELITRENIRKEELTTEQLLLINEKTGGNSSANPEDYGYSEILELYTHIKLIDGKYTLYQEIEGVKVKDDVVYEKDELPYIAPRLYKQSDLNYGESYVYRFYDDLRDLNNFRKYFIQGAAILTRLIYLVKPGGRTNVRNIVRAKNGGFAEGQEGDIYPLQPNNVVQLRELSTIMDSIKQELRESFLMLTVRNSERTTAEEIRANQEELDQQLGGVFSTLAQELQAPSVKIAESILKDHDPSYKHIPFTTDKIVTGVEAIGRSQEVQTLRTFLGLVAETAQMKPEIVDYVNEEFLVDMILKASGVDEEAMLQTQEVQQLRAQRQQAMQQAAMQQQMLESGGKMAEESVKQAGNQQ